MRSYKVGLLGGVSMLAIMLASGSSLAAPFDTINVGTDTVVSGSGNTSKTVAGTYTTGGVVSQVNSVGVQISGDGSAINGGNQSYTITSTVTGNDGN